MALLLCNVCQQVLRTYGTAEDGDFLAETTERLEARAAKGCRLCSLVVSTSRGGEISTQRDILSHFYEKNQSRGEILITYMKKEEPSMTQDFDSYLDLFIAVGDDSDPSIRLFSKAIIIPISYLESPSSENKITAPETVSDESLITAQKWIKNCKTTHLKCQEKAISFLPTRLIDIGDGMMATIRLRLNKDVLPGSSYFTLSHCWGTKPMPERLLQENLQSRYVTIDYNKLPKSFQDAIDIVKRLGGRYLWIDSLCIIQDSAEDWQHESALMGQVYLNGFCNLSAVAAQDSSIGLTFSRDLDEVLPIWTTTRKDGCEQAIVVCDPRLWRDGVIGSHLLRRAWVCQERMLSSCNLHFSNAQLFWECSTTIACETFPEKIPAKIERWTVEPMVKSSAAHLLRDSLNLKLRSLDDPLNPLRLWDRIVETYSNAKLTYGTDKLIALGGIAAMSHSSFMENGKRYLAGLWEQFLSSQILWESSTSHDLSPPAYRAPSWSWAAVDEKILAHEVSSTCRSLIEIVDAQVDLLDEKHPYGQVKGGHLQLKCQLVPAHIDRYGFLSPKFSKIEGGFVCSWDYSLKMNPQYKDETLCMVPVCLENGYIKAESSDGGQSHRLTGLTLCPTKDGSGSFIRCGIFQVEDEDADDILQCCQSFGEDPKGSGLRCLHEGDESVKYLIKIV